MRARLNCTFASGHNPIISIIFFFLLALILVTFVVLVRKANQEDVEWTEDGFEDEEFEDDQSTESDLDSDLVDHADLETVDENETSLSPPHIQDDERASLAKKAAEVGVMQAISGTEQGSSGWYVDVSTEMQYWDVGTDGSWTRVE